ncbi:MAG: hypothetical protein QXV46_05575 [Candidatus Bathyarchaeia archaeon]
MVCRSREPFRTSILYLLNIMFNGDPITIKEIYSNTEYSRKYSYIFNIFSCTSSAGNANSALLVTTAPNQERNIVVTY